MIFLILVKDFLPKQSLMAEMMEKKNIWIYNFYNSLFSGYISGYSIYVGGFSNGFLIFYRNVRWVSVFRIENEMLIFSHIWKHLLLKDLLLQGILNVSLETFLPFSLKYQNLKKKKKTQIRKETWTSRSMPF